LVDIAKNEGIRHVLSSHPNMMAAAAPESYPWTDKAENLFPAAPGICPALIFCHRPQRRIVTDSMVLIVKIALRISGG